MAVTRLILARDERSLVWKCSRFVGVMGPGVRWIVAPFARMSIHLYDTNVAEFEHPRVDSLLRRQRAALEQHFEIVELGERQVGFVYKRDQLACVLAPGKRQLYWKGPIAVHIERIGVASEPDVAVRLERLLAHAAEPRATRIRQVLDDMRRLGLHAN